jgi:hypothetical protein
MWFRGMALALPKGLHYFVSFFLCVHSTIPLERERHLLKVDEHSCDSLYAYALTFSLRFLRFEEQLEEYERELRRVICHLRSSHMFRIQCTLEVDTSILEAKRYLDVILFNVLQCIIQVCGWIYKTHREPQKGSLLRWDAVKDVNHALNNELWFSFLYNFLAISRLQFPKLLLAVYQTYDAFVRVIKIPEHLEGDVLKSVVRLSHVPTLAVTLSSSFDSFFVYFIEKAVSADSFFRAIANQFIFPTDFDTDLIQLRERLAYDRSYQTVTDRFGSLFALSLFYLTDAKVAVRTAASHVVYHLILFSFLICDGPTHDVVSHLEKIRTVYISSAFHVPASILQQFSHDCASLFHFAAASFVDSSLEILRYQTERPGRPRSFMSLAAPWFGYVECNARNLSRLLSASYQSQAHFGQYPIATDAIPILSAIIGQRPQYVLNFLLDKPVHSKALCVYICQTFGSQMVAFLIEHLRFEYWLTENEKYQSEIGLILSVLLDLVEDKSVSLIKHYHLIYLFCYIQYEIFPICLTINQRIECFEFSDGQKREICDEAFKWITCCGEISIALKATNLLNEIAKFRDPQKCEQLLNTISILYHLFAESQTTELQKEMVFISCLLKLASTFDPMSSRLYKNVLELLNCNSPQLFDICAHLIETVIIPFHPDIRSRADCLLFRLLSFPFSNDEQVQTIVRVLLQFQDYFTDKKAFYAALSPFSVDLATRVEKINVRSVITDLVSGISAERCYVILTFFMHLLDVSKVYYDTVFRICREVVKFFGNRSPICPTVFAPLVKLLLAKPARSDEEVEFLALLEDQKMSQMPSQQDMRLPALDLELKLNKIPFKPVGFAGTPAHRLIQQALAEFPRPELQVLKEKFLMAETAQGGVSVEFDMDEIRARINGFLQSRKPAWENRGLGEVDPDLFAIQKIDYELFKPSLQDVDAVGDLPFPSLCH